MATTTLPWSTTRGRRRGGEPLAIAASIGLPVLLLVIFLALPLGLVGVYSFYSLDPVTGLMQRDFSLENYRTIVSSPIYLKVFWRTFQIAAVATVIALLLAYPMGYVIGVLVPQQRQGSLLLLVIVLYWTSFSVRTYRWIGILQENGYLQSPLGWMPGSDLNVLYTRTAVIVGFVHVFLPLMILTSFYGFDRRLEEASQDLGANEWRTFRRVTLSLVLPGIVGGALIAVTIPFDEFVPTFFVAGAGVQTLPHVLLPYLVFVVAGDQRGRRPRCRDLDGARLLRPGAERAAPRFGGVRTTSSILGGERPSSPVIA